MWKMASLCSWGKKDGASIQSVPAAETSVPCPPEPVQEQEPCSLMPPLPPLNKDTLGGEVAITYESMNGKTQRHYTQIFIDPRSMPVITVSSKPDNSDYLEVKHELLSQAYHSLREYTEFVLSLKGMHDRSDLGRALELIVKRFLTRFWDMPASREHHHSYPWGFVLHCLDVGCAEAEKATSWKPMSQHGIDEINLSRYLGMVVFLNFAKGLFHDAHKLYQYGMTGYKDNYTVRFDPLRNQGNVLDFKLVYPQRAERWGEPFASPGKLNVVEFFALYPRELIKYAPGWQFLEVIMGLFDMEGSDSDRESAKRDLDRIGLATLEQMILDKVEAYFTTDKEETKPENNVFRVNDDWAAVLSAPFLMKVRLMEGRIYTKDAVKTYLQQEGALSGTAGSYDISLLYRVKRPNGSEEVSKSRAKVAFIRMPYLEQVCSDLHTMLGQIYFDEKDRDAILELCPGAENFLQDLNRNVADQPVAPPTEQSANDAESMPARDDTSREEAQPADSSVPETASVPGTAPQVPDEKNPHEKAEQQADSDAQAPEAQPVAHDSPEPEEKALEAPDAVQANAAGNNIPAISPKPKKPVRKMVKWSSQLRYLMEHCQPDDLHPATGWLYVDFFHVYVRTPDFYQEMTNEHFLQQDDWRSIAASMCRELAEERLLIMEAITGLVSFITPGNGAGRTEGHFFKLNLGTEAHSDLLDRVVAFPPSD